MPPDFNHLSRLRPQEAPVWAQLEQSLNDLLAYFRRPYAALSSDEIAGRVRRVGAALAAAGLQEAPWQWEAATPSEDRARQLLGMGTAATAEWVGRLIFGPHSDTEGIDLGRIRGHVAAFAEALRYAVAPVEAAGKQRGPGERPESGPLPLTKTEQAVLGIIRAQPKGKGIYGKEIIAKLKGKKLTLKESTLRRHVLPKLKERFGVVNQPGAGGYLIP